MEKLLKLIFPEKCTFCGQFGDVFCVGCLKKCKILMDSYCIVCDDVSIGGSTHKDCMNLQNEQQTKNETDVKFPSRLITLFSYEGVVRECIKRAKFSSREFLAFKRLAQFGCIYAVELGLDFRDFISVPIPVSSNRMRERGFNQSEMITKVICGNFKIKMGTSILVRKRDTPHQTTFDRALRFKNVENAFKVNKKVEGANILLVDDICTTGATFLEASKVLLNAGAANVECFVLSKKLKV
ncbi:hypothetical protein A2W32_01625 [candidate division WWE3 bacterium RBG_16_37_10]|uniref:Phosphoribosyltransferase domain-containing protein n=1 Tax=candidate division WWE3 bacterium RBG_16_37_10 TaxID=1802610 RepID=A0A1F4USU0_UNCKA|nr:MAG: hypothetical protein A2W32_01625 [candidate division WWE3 bacterium RBG_16_37_10]